MQAKKPEISKYLVGMQNKMKSGRQMPQEATASYI